MLTHKQLRAKALENAVVKAEYEKLADGFSLSDEDKAHASEELALKVPNARTRSAMEEARAMAKARVGQA